MSVEPRQALYAHLVADPGVIAAVGDRVYQRRVPGDAQKPLVIVWPLVSRVPTRDLSGVAYHTARLQVTAMGSGKLAQPDAEKAARAVRAAVEGFSGLMAGALRVIEVEVVDDTQVDQDGIDEIHHHVILRIMYKEE